MNNCFSIIFKEECEKREETLAYHEKQMSLSLAIMPRNPIITARAVITNGNWTEWSRIQGVIGRVISNRPSPYSRCFE